MSSTELERRYRNGQFKLGVHFPYKEGKINGLIRSYLFSKKYYYRRTQQRLFHYEYFGESILSENIRQFFAIGSERTKGFFLFRSHMISLQGLKLTLDKFLKH